MAVFHVLVARSPEQVWSVLADGWAYDEWVVGTSEILEVDPAWPAVDASIRFRIGQGPVRFEDHTVVRICEPERRLELEAHAAPLGTARIAIQLLPWGDETLVIFDEHPLRGPGARLHTAVVDAVMQLRNRRMVQNLARLVERRTERRATVSGG